MNINDVFHIQTEKKEEINKQITDKELDKPLQTLWEAFQKLAINKPLLKKEENTLKLLILLDEKTNNREMFHHSRGLINNFNLAHTRQKIDIDNVHEIPNYFEGTIYENNKEQIQFEILTPSLLIYKEY